MMTIAVLMSTFNGEKYLREQIDSILNQSGNFQLDLWVRDDGSTDQTTIILEEYFRKGLLNWYSGRNLSPAYSFLDLIIHCPKYDFYAFADQDDYWIDDKMKSAINVIKDQNGPALYFSNAKLVGSKLEPLGRNVYKQYPKTDFYTLSCAGGLLGCTMVFDNKLATFIQNHQVPKRIILHDFYISVLCLALGGKIYYEDTPHIKYRQHSNNVVGVSSSFKAKISNRINNIVKKPKVSISEQAKSILELYSNEMKSENMEWLLVISKYNINLFNRLSLAISRKTRYINYNMGFKLRMSILFGNR